METPVLAKPSPRKHQRVVQSLRKLAITLAPGDRLPSVAELGRQFGVSASPVKAAIEMLRREGLVESRPGSGTYIAHAARPGANGSAFDGAHLGVATGILAVLAPRQDPFYRHCMDELTAQAEPKGLKVVCHYGNWGTSVADALDLEALRPAGYLLFNYRLAPIAAALLKRGHRAVVVGVPPAEVIPSVSCVHGDHEHGGYLATRRLLDLGHRRIGFATTLTKEELATKRRWRGHVRALGAAGVLEAASVIDLPVLQSWRGDPAIVRRHFDRGDAPTAVVAWTDAEAMEWISLLGGAGLRVPDEVSLVGYDNVPVGAHSRPALDTIDPHTEVQVRQALAMLLSPVEPGSIPTAVVTPTLLSRDSSAPRR